MRPITLEKMKVLLLIINTIALVAAIIWWMTVRDWEPAVTSIALFGTLLGQLFTNEEVKSKINFTQEKSSSHNFVAARDQTITDNKKIQIANDGSQPIQAEIVNINNGINEQRAREIYQEMNLQLRKDYSHEAFQTAISRISEFENILMPKMDAVNGALEAFADPGFQLLLVEAQKTAAATERPIDYHLLSELLLHRFQKGGNRFTRAGISRAVEIVDKISDDALLGLTVSHAVTAFVPVSGDIHEGLKVLNVLFEKILYGPLPDGSDWLDHLDILDAVRINSFGNMKKISQFYPERLAGYVEPGIEKESEDHKKAIELLRESKLSLNILVDHAFNSNFVRLNVSDKDQIARLKLTQKSVRSGQTIVTENPLSEEQKNTLYSIYKLYKQDGNIKSQNIKLLMDEWDKHSSLKALREWWDKISSAFQITSVGKVLAHSNAQRCDKSLPPLN